MSMVRGSVGFELLRVFALLDSYAGIQALIAAISCNVSCVCVCNKIPVSDEPAGGDDAHSKGGDTVYDAAGRDVYMYTMIVMVTVMVITKLMMIVIMSRAGF